MICVKVPATTANFGAGFDSLGAALDYYNCIWMEEWDGCWIEILDDTDVPTDETNLIYQTPELLERPYYINCDMSKYIALVIDTLNHDGSISSILNPIERIQNVVNKYKNGEEI